MRIFPLVKISIWNGIQNLCFRIQREGKVFPIKVRKRSCSSNRDQLHSFITIYMHMFSLESFILFAFYFMCEKRLASIRCWCAETLKSSSWNRRIINWNRASIKSVKKDQCWEDALRIRASLSLSLSLSLSHPLSIIRIWNSTGNSVHILEFHVSN